MPIIDDAGKGPRPIQGADTVAAFVGVASGAPRAATRVESPMDFEGAFGRGGGDELSAAVSLFFENGGGPLWIAPSLAALETGPPVDLLVLPGEGKTAALAAAIAWAEAHGAFVVLEPPSSVTTAKAALAWIDSAKALRSRNAAAYFPRLLQEGGPSANAGAVAAVILRHERERGVWKAPAGPDATVVGASGLAVGLAAGEQQALGEQGVNVLRTLPTGRTVVWGARTLTPHDDPWKYVPVRRFVLYLERSLEQGLKWTVFEPNGANLWAVVRASAERFLDRLFRNGALMGVRPSEAYFVRCDRTTMTQDDIDNGRLVVEVGVAPVKPAEFVILQIGLWTADAKT